MLEIIGYILIFIMGIMLGVLGVGGAILTTPILIYFFGFTPSNATHYSLLIIGLCCIIGTYRYHSLYTLKTKTLFLFAPLSTITAYFTRHWLIPNLPNKIITINQYSLTNENFILLTFTLTLCLSSFLLLRPPHPDHSSNISEHPLIPLIPISLFTGFLCGLIGVGGGFIMIPVFTSLLKIPIKQAIGTSMAISCVQVLAAFMGGIQGGQTPHPELITSFALLAIGGLYLGTHLSFRVNHQKLKQAFSLFTLLLALTILFEKFIIHLWVE